MGGGGPAMVYIPTSLVKNAVCLSRRNSGKLEGILDPDPHKDADPSP